MDFNVILNAGCMTSAELMRAVTEGSAARKYDDKELKAIALSAARLRERYEEVPDPLTDAFKMMNSSATVECWWRFPAGGSLITRLRILRYKIIRKFIFFYFKQVFDMQNCYNAAVLAAMSESIQKIHFLEHQNIALKKRLDILERNQ
ncbi:MAG: hypothetical protein LBR54_03475 [Oscillospiraceae bacterium]|jgi:hypothetical protein|nr:hypothetical protein [Oscillospiraceae bacterium]